MLDCVVQQGIRGWTDKSEAASAAALGVQSIARTRGD